MTTLVALTIGLVAWIILWAVGFRAFDAFLITTLLVTLGATARLLAPYLPGRE